MGLITKIIIRGKGSEDLKSNYNCLTEFLKLTHSVYLLITEIQDLLPTLKEFKDVLGKMDKLKKTIATLWDKTLLGKHTHCCERKETVHQVQKEQLREGSLQNRTPGAELGEVEFGKRGQSNKENSKCSQEFVNLVDRQNWKTISKVCQWIKMMQVF